MSTVRRPAPPPVAPKPLHLTTRGRAQPSRVAADRPLPRWSAHASVSNEAVGAAPRPARLSDVLLDDLLGAALGLDLPVTSQAYTELAEGPCASPEDDGSSCLTLKARPAQKSEFSRSAVALYPFEGHAHDGELSFDRSTTLTIEKEGQADLMGWSIGYLSDQGEASRGLIPKGWYQYAELQDSPPAQKRTVIVSGIEFEPADGYTVAFQGDSQHFLEGFTSDSDDALADSATSLPETTDPALAPSSAEAVESQAPTTWQEWVQTGCSRHGPSSERHMIDDDCNWLSSPDSEGTSYAVRVGSAKVNIDKGSHIVFPVVTEFSSDVVQSAQMLEVERRYSSFSALYECLILYYSLLHIEQLPAKSYVLRFDKSFLAARARGLERWMESIARHPVLSCDERVRAFLSLEDDRELAGVLDPRTICPCLFLSSIYHGDFIDAEDDLKNALESFESKIAMTEAEGAISRLASEVQRAKQRFEATNEGRVRIDQLLWATSAIFEIAQVPKSEPREAVDIALFQTAADALRDLSKARARFKIFVRRCHQVLKILALENPASDQMERLDTVVWALISELLYHTRQLKYDAERLVELVRSLP